MSRSQARAVARTDVSQAVRRWLLLGFAMAAAGFVWAASASAQSAPVMAGVAAAQLAEGMDAGARLAEPMAGPAGDVAPVSAGDVADVALISTGGVNAAPSGATQAVGPRLVTSDLRYVPSAARADAPAMELERMQERNMGLGRNVAFIIVGIVAMAIGSDVDDAPGTLLVVGGAGMTLYGLFHLLR